PSSVGPVLRRRAARSDTWSPIAAPPRGACVEPLRRKMPKGRFWIGKSQPGSFADSTQLFRSGSCVASMAYPSGGNLHLSRISGLLEAIPDLVVVLLQLGCAQGGSGGAEDVGRLPRSEERRVGHECGRRC